MAATEPSAVRGFRPTVSRPRIGILVVAYNAESTLDAVLDRIPESFRSSIDAVLVSDDHSTDTTYEAGVAYQDSHGALPLTIVRQGRNLGYGGNQKFGYRWLIDHGLDIAVLLHGDGQYAPEVLPTLLAPLLDGRADFVMGSRMLGGHPRKGGMPLYKFVGNKILTRFQNAVTGLRLSEWHSGYRAFSLALLDEIPFEENSDGFDFDTEVLLQLHDAGARIAEVPIPTYYGDEICHVNGLKYAWDVCADVLRYRVARLGFGASRLARWSTAHAWKETLNDGDRAVLDSVRHLEPRRVLVLSASSSQLIATELESLGHQVVILKDPAAGLSAEAVAYAPFDLLIAADAVEHLAAPEALLAELHHVCSPDASLVATVPNISHWYPRMRVALGCFDYDHRGILDATHMRFFTWRSFRGMAYRSGWLVERRRITGLPLETLSRRGGHPRKGRLSRLLSILDRAGRIVWPSLFAYEYVAVLNRDPARVRRKESEPSRPSRLAEIPGRG